MKLASIDNATRDGRLVLVSRDLRRISETKVVTTMQQLLDDWDRAFPILQQENEDFLHSNDGQSYANQNFLAPLPRAYEWIDGSAYINHVVLVRKARKAEPPPTLRTDPLVYQGGSGVFLGPEQDIPLGDPAWGCDFESEVCVVLADTPQGTQSSRAADFIRLVMIANDVSLRNLIPDELAKGFGFFQSKPATAFGPVAVTPDELGDAWKDGRIHLPLLTHLNDQLFGDPNAGPEMHFSFFDLIQHCTKTRSYTAGTIIGSGTVSNEDRSRGSSCLAEKRMLEIIDAGVATTPFLKFGDRVRIEMFAKDGQSIFGRIQQKVVPT